MDPKWRTFVVLLIVLGGVSAAIAVFGGGSSTPAIDVRQAPLPGGGVELLVTVSDEVNVADTTGGEELVTLICTDAAGGDVVRSQQTWPLSRDGDPPAPHVHQPVSEAELCSIAACRLEGTDPELSGEVGLAR